MSILEIKNLKYAYSRDSIVFKNINVNLEEGKVYSILGHSGSGKTTFLSLLGGLDTPTEGEILFKGENIENYGLAKHRKDNVSFIFQSYNLIDYLTPMENVSIASKLPPKPILEKLGLTDKEMKRNVLKLSGGQQQRVAIARALASEAPVLLADEPTGNLDPETSKEIISLLERINEKQNTTVLVVTHDSKIVQEHKKRTILIEDGCVNADTSLGGYEI